MRLLVHCFPRDDPKLHNQTELSDISDEDYTRAYTPVPQTTAQRITQVIFFVIFGGWIRVLLMIVATLVYLVLLSPFMALAYRLDIIGNYVWIAQYISQYYIRTLMFCFGIYYIKWEGTPDPETRQISYNHTSITDGPLIYIRQIFTVAVIAGIKNVPFFGRIAILSSSVLIDRSKSEGNSQALKSCIEDHKRWPVAVAPEGKISDGSIMFKFRTGGFLCDEQIQPCAIRYYHALPWSGSTLNWIVDSFYEWLWLSVTCPGAVAVIKFLKPFTKEELKDKTPEERAMMTQLAIANELGTLAINRTSKEIFQKETETEKEKQKKE